jgi:hypothetical protein
MRHSRADYNRIQDPANLIPKDEPVFLLRAQDKTAPSIVRAWASAQRMNPKADPKMIYMADQHAAVMEEWQAKNSYQWADLPDKLAKDSSFDMGEVSDGYHTFNELYEHRITLFITLCNVIEAAKLNGTFSQLNSHIAWKSKKHSDGEPAYGGGWFVLGPFRVKASGIKQ